MTELSYKQISGIILLVITLSAGSIIVLEKTGDYVNCRGDWILQEDGKYFCEDRNITEYCYEIEYRGSGWYRCWIGHPVEIENPYPWIGKQYSCNQVNCTEIQQN